MNNPEKIYRFHVTNLREIQSALLRISLLARRVIADSDRSEYLRSLVRLYALVLGCWAETRLRKLLYERGAFSEEERGTILRKRPQLEQWKLLIELSFRKHYEIPKERFSEISLGVANYARYRILHEVLDEELAIVIQIRNKLAHGQWVFPLNDDETGVNPDYFKKIKKENLLSLQFKFELLKHLADLTHDLVASLETFERDFDFHFRRLDQARTNLKRRHYSKYVDSLVARRMRHKHRVD